jgi:hypothetical protein
MLTSLPPFFNNAHVEGSMLLPHSRQVDSNLALLISPEETHGNAR